MSGYSFPLAATTVTDDFNRANETPIGSPWDVTDWSGAEAALIGNAFSTQDRGGYFDGGATYGTTNYIDYEMSVSIGFSTSNSQYLQMAVTQNQCLIDADIAISQRCGVFTHTYTFGASTVSSGDIIGYREVGGVAEIFVNGVYKGGRPRCDYTPGVIRLYLYSEASNISITEFRIASVGSILPQYHIAGRGAA